MPFKSKRQARYFRVLEREGKIRKGTSHRWAKHTKNMKRLPKRAKKRKSTRRRGR